MKINHSNASRIKQFSVCIFITIVFSGGAFAQASKKQTQSRPNIIVFMVDDMGWMDTSLPFGESVMPLNKKYHTPNMERLAKEGMKFTNSYAQPVCTPTRVSMLTGMNSAQTKITNWTSPAKNSPTDAADSQFKSSDWNYNGLSPLAGIPHTIHATPFPQLLKDSGYFTVHIGKAHWGSAGTPGANPMNLGFIVNIAGHSAGHPQSYLSEDFYGNRAGKGSWQSVPDLEEYYDTGTFLTDALTKEAIKTIDKPINDKQPFYLNMAHYAIHDPIMADPRYHQKYVEAGLDAIEAKYASLIEGMDTSLGEIMDYLVAKKVDKNTIIIFMSDNGAMEDWDSKKEYNGVHPSNDRLGDNTPLRDWKTSNYEGAIRVPCAVYWKGHLKSYKNESYISVIDLLPSILFLAGDKNLPQTIEGKNVWSAISENKAIPNQEIYVRGHLQESLIQKPGKIIRTRHLAIPADYELFNIEKDPSEKNNVILQNEALAEKMKMALENQFQKDAKEVNLNGIN